MTIVSHIIRVAILAVMGYSLLREIIWEAVGRWKPGPIVRMISSLTSIAVCCWILWKVFAEIFLK